jgi:P4 family phage/plasmid primase-like protien
VIQIVAQRGGFVHTNPPLVAESVVSLFENYKDVLVKLKGMEPINLYYTLAHHSGAGEASDKPARTAATFAHQGVLAWDIDSADGTKALDYAACVAAVLDCPVSSVTAIGSGNGVHLLVNLKYHIHQAKFFKEMKDAYAEVCLKIAEKMLQAGLPGKVDASIFEPARVLRLPGTINRKPDKADKNCELVQLSKAELDIDLYKISGLADAEKENISPKEVSRQYPQPDFNEIYTECKFVGWAVEKVDEVHEPHAFDFFSIMATMPPDGTVLHQGREVSAKELSQYVFDNATASKSLLRSVFDEKWQQASRYGVRKCDTIEARWGQCRTCPHFGKVPTPLALKSPEHIGSEQNGYWVFGNNNRLLHPHYSDLSRVYKREHTYITTKDERVFSWVGTHYVESPDISIKHWMENKVRPSDPVKEQHRNEFLAKLRVCGAMTPEMEHDLFAESVRGKLNCKNGVVDIMTGKRLEHSPTVGFQYVLPFEYHEELSSEYFLDWLAVICQDRVELMESILDVMAYCLWPSYDDHVFVYLVGEGSNGKSTLIHIIEAMMGRRNYSAVNIHQLTGNRFAPADLEGKLVNLSEESSGSELTSDHLNVLKNLSSGGEMFIERKGEQGYSFRNSAKLIFSANKTPRFAEQGHAIKRRLLTIPFDYRITDPDSTVEDRLIEEIPGILAMLVRRIQDNVVRNEGRFVVSRGAHALNEAQKKFLTTGNTAVQWAGDCLETSNSLGKDVYACMDDCYESYKEWCEENGVRYPASKKSFLSTLREHVITPVGKEGDTTKVKKASGWKSARVFRFTRLVDKELD